MEQKKEDLYYMEYIIIGICVVVAAIYITVFLKKKVKQTDDEENN